MPQHWHDYAHFVLVLGGACTDTCRNSSQRYTLPHLVFYPAGEPHVSHFHGMGARTFEIQMDREWLQRVREYSIRVDEPCGFAGGLPVWIGARIYNEFRDIDAMTPLAIHGLALELLAETSRRDGCVNERKPPQWLRQAREILHAQFTESVSLDDIAEAVGVHPVHLARAFRQQYHCTVGEYIRELRMESAQRQLSTSEASIAETAASAGFSDQSHFCRVLKRHTGLTPTEFRKHFGLR